MDKDVLSFTKVKPPQDLIDEIWCLNVKNLQHIADIDISRYTIALSQWLIYYRAQVNQTKAQINKLKSDMEFLISTWMTPDLLKEHKTKTAAREYLINTQPETSSMRDLLEKLQRDMAKVEGIDKAATELITSLKRELTRRENELYTMRKERYH